MLDHADGLAGLEEADDGCSRRGAVDVRRGEQRRHQRAGHEGAPELLEHERSLGHTEVEPAVGLGKGQREHAGVAELAPAVAIEATGGFDPADVVEGEPAVEEGPHALLQ